MCDSARWFQSRMMTIRLFCCRSDVLQRTQARLSANRIRATDFERIVTTMDEAHSEALLLLQEEQQKKRQLLLNGRSSQEDEW